MMAIPKGGLSGKKLHFFQVKEPEPNKFEAKLKSFIKKPEDFAELVEKVKTCCDGTGEFLQSNPMVRTMLFIVTEQEKFMECAMSEGLIFRR